MYLTIFSFSPKKKNPSNTTKQQGGQILQGTNMTSQKEVTHCASDWEPSQDKTDSHDSEPRTILVISCWKMTHLLPL